MGARQLAERIVSLTPGDDSMALLAIQLLERTGMRGRAAGCDVCHSGVRISSEFSIANNHRGCPAEELGKPEEAG